MAGMVLSSFLAARCPMLGARIPSRFAARGPLGFLLVVGLLGARCSPSEGDLDGDGYLAPDDCDDEVPSVHPGAEEVCNFVDDDCDGEVDGEGAFEADRWYLDADGDGVGGSTAGPLSCVPLNGYASFSGVRQQQPHGTERLGHPSLESLGSLRRAWERR